MPPARRFHRWRLGLPAAALLLVAALAAVALFLSWGAESAERADYGRVEVGMTEQEVQAVLGRRFTMKDSNNVTWWQVSWHSDNGARVNVQFDAGGRVAVTEFREGDLSLRGKVKRFIEGLPSW
jgi:hypothetical protein